MSGFSAQWLALREPADHAARSLKVVRWLASHLPQRRTLRVVDLGAGTGSNLRYLAPLLPGIQHWTLVDHDAALLAAVPTVMRDWQPAQSPGSRIVETRQLDLTRDSAALEFGDCDLVTTAALLDLVSDDWLSRLARQCREANVAVLFALSYDGRIEFTPTEPEDAVIVTLFNRHQHTDKGFGPSLGPAGWRRALKHLAAAGYAIREGPSDWQLGPDSSMLQRELIEGWATAALQVDMAMEDVIAGWRDRRLQHVNTGQSHLLVGHRDIAAVPEG